MDHVHYTVAQVQHVEADCLVRRRSAVACWFVRTATTPKRTSFCWRMMEDCLHCYCGIDAFDFVQIVRAAQSLHDKILSILHGSSTQDTFRWGRHDNDGRDEDRERGGRLVLPSVLGWRQTRGHNDGLRLVECLHFKGNPRGLLCLPKASREVKPSFIAVEYVPKLQNTSSRPNLANFPKQNAAIWFHQNYFEFLTRAKKG